MTIPAALDAGTRTGWPLVSSLPPLAALPTAPGTARAHVTAVLAGWKLDALAEAAQLVTSELVTNALRASTTPAGRPRYVNGRMALIWVCLMSDTSRTLIEVHDQAAGEPVIQAADPDAETGRGLQMVSLLSEQWGWHPKIRQDGKCVWVLLRNADPEPEPRISPVSPRGRTGLRSGQ